MMASGSMGAIDSGACIKSSSSQSKKRIAHRNRCFSARSNFPGVHRWLELCAARRDFVTSRTRSKAPNLGGEKSRVMCIYQEFAQKHKTSSREPATCDSARPPV